jgi:hypothetical protein
LYESEFTKPFFTLSAGSLLKLFSITKKAQKQAKKTFNLLLLFLKKLLFFKNKTIIVLVFKNFYKSLTTFVKNFVKIFKLTRFFYICRFNVKKYKIFNFFKQKKAIKKKLIKKLRLLS